MVTRIRLVRVVGIDSDRSGNVAVRLLLLFRFSCIGAVSVLPGCRPHFERRRDVVFLREESGRWLIVKPGLIYQDTSLDAPPAGVDLVTPPGDSSTVNRLASIGAPPVLCPSGGVGASDGRRYLEPAARGPNSRRGPARAAPWLDITRVSVVRLARQELCVTISLAGAPRADSSYSVDLGQPQNGGETLDAYALEIDGTGGLHARLRDAHGLYGHGAPACATGLGLTDDQLELIISPGDHVFRNDAPIGIDASSESCSPVSQRSATRSTPPISRRPLSAWNCHPSELTISPAASRSGGAEMDTSR